jgi:hypothetical protein
MRACVGRRAAAIPSLSLSYCAGRGALSERRRQYRQWRANQYTISASTLTKYQIAAAVCCKFSQPGPIDDAVVDAARPADRFRMAVECRFRLSDTNRNVA